MTGRGGKSAPDFGRLRESMVRSQLAARGIQSERVLAAMRAVPRHAFVDAALQSLAYADRPLNIGYGQTISQPYMVAVMTELLDPAPGQRVLEIGTGSGYQAAVLAELAGEVITVERHAPLAEHAAALLADLGCTNVTVEVGDGTLGWPAAAPYDGILVTAGGPAPPRPLFDQLAEGGRLVCPVGPRDAQSLKVYTRNAGQIDEREVLRCLFVPLIGEAGWGA